MDAMIALVALLVSLCSFLISLDIWRRSSRPIVTVAVKTNAGGNQAILYDLVVLNSGTLPAKNVRINAEKNSLALALGGDATEPNKKRWLACFGEVIPILHPNEKTSCSFCTTQADDTGFWKYRATLRLTVTYEGRWWKHQQTQEIRIANTDSFTGYSWG
jgi:hypothetical protein